MRRRARASNVPGAALRKVVKKRSKGTAKRSGLGADLPERRGAATAGRGLLRERRATCSWPTRRHPVPCAPRAPPPRRRRPHCGAARAPAPPAMPSAGTADFDRRCMCMSCISYRRVHHVRMQGRAAAGKAARPRAWCIGWRRRG
jgi:hypothetical protein